MRSRGSTARTLAAVSLVVLTLAGCGSGPQPHEDTPSSTSRSISASAPSASASIDPRAQPAVDAYRRYTVAANNAERKPPAIGADYPADADFSKYSFDPMRYQYETFIRNLSNQRVEFRGTPPAHRLSVISVNLSAVSYPTVVLSDCPTPAPTWKGYAVKTGEVVPYASAKFPPPYQLTVEVIRYKGHWGVREITADMSHTCTG